MVNWGQWSIADISLGNEPGDNTTNSTEAFYDRISGLPWFFTWVVISGVSSYANKEFWQQVNTVMPMVIVRYFNAVAMAITGTSSPASPDRRCAWFHWLPAHRGYRGCNDEYFFQRTDTRLSVRFYMMKAKDCRGSRNSPAWARKQLRYLVFAGFTHGLRSARTVTK